MTKPWIKQFGFVCLIVVIGAGIVYALHPWGKIEPQERQTPSSTSNDVSIVVPVSDHDVKSFLGVRYRLIDEEVMRRYRLPVAYGALLGADSESLPAIIPGSPAERAGLRERDIITHVDLLPVDARADLSFLLDQKLPGDPVVLRVIRDNRPLTRLIVLDEGRL